MAAAQQPQRPAAQTAAAVNGNKTPAEMLEDVLRATGSRQQIISEALNNPERIRQIEELLPDFMKDQAARLVKRAMVTFARKSDDYKEVYPPSFIRAVLEAAELGLAIDGRLAHAVVFNNKVKVGGKEEWRKEVQLMVDYKGIVAVARRNKALVDVWARLIFENDELTLWEEDGVQKYRHVPKLVDRGALKGVLSVILFAGGRVKYDWMDNKEVDAVRSRSKSWNAKEGGSGPWRTDDGEMRKKTGIRRVLKLYIDDPAVARLLEVEANDMAERETSSAPPKPADLREVVEAKAEEVRKRRATSRQPSSFTQADSQTEPGLPAPEDAKQQAQEETAPVVQEPADDEGDAYEGSMEQPQLQEETKPVAEKKSPERAKVARPPADDGVV